MSVIWTILAFIVIFSVLVVVHEFGHFIVARANGIDVKEFAVGMGPKLIRIPGKSTDFVLRALPIGGACVFEDEDPFDDEDDEARKEENALEKTDEKGSGKFSDAPLPARIITTLAGPFFNLLLGFVLAMIIVALCGEYSTKVGEVIKDSPAQAAGLQAGDTIIKINNERIYLFNEITLQTITGRNDNWEITYIRDGREYVTHATIGKLADGDDGKYLGIYPTNKVNCANFKMFEYGWYEVRYWLKATFKSLGMLLTGRLSKDDVAGPVGVAQVIGTTIKETQEYGVLNVIINLADIALLLSVNLAVMNLLPFPALDGGRLLFLLYELIFRKKVPRKYEAIVTLVGFGILMVLMVLVLINDVSRFFRK